MTPDPQSNAGYRPKNTARVYCPEHHVKCLAARSEENLTRYYCPMPGCTFARKVTRPAPVEPDTSEERQGWQP